MTVCLELLQSHRSIRKFTEQPIEDRLLRDLISAASAATSSNLQGVSAVREVPKPAKQWQSWRWPGLCAASG